ncbi:hypothetical protein ACM66B_000123 [Microbotryomycetes sp. NB124-2]
MPIGHLRLNNPNAVPNPNINFIHAIKDLPNSDMAQKMLEALAAQFKPVMKERGFAINSLVEAEWNPQYAGRNWNAGEVVEIVLRRPDKSFAPWKFILMVMAHECAHIKEMNHSNAFQKVNAELRKHVHELRGRGYYGDGFWSSGHSLKYGEIEKPFEPDEVPEFICGGADKKPSTRKRRRRSGPSKARGQPVKLGKTGRQTAIPKKAGSRVTRQGAFKGEGNVMDDSPEASTFKKRANALNAVKARAEAAERRLQSEQDSKGKLKLEIKDDDSEVDQLESSENEPDTEDEEEEETGAWIKREKQEGLKLTKEEQDWLNREMQGYWGDEDLVVQGHGAGVGGTVTRGGSSNDKKKKAKDKTQGGTQVGTSKSAAAAAAATVNGIKTKGKTNGKTKNKTEVIVLDDSSDDDNDD